jgi:hypothetical protein
MLFKLKRREPILHVVLAIVYFYDNMEDFAGRKKFLARSSIILSIK